VGHDQLACADLYPRLKQLSNDDGDQFDGYLRAITRGASDGVSKQTHGGVGGTLLILFINLERMPDYVS
jgi:hypothetical protein